MKLLRELPMTTFKGNVFDIKRFATHDGDGIRTTVFLKGCPLRCVWCQNPEGLKSTKEILYLENKCIHCLTCVRLSKHKGIECIDGKLIVHREIEDDWDLIVDMCPTMALTYDAKEYGIEELCDEIFKDEPFFKRGGGITFSGGEPFSQVDFMVEVLKACKKRNIHTAMESSFYTSLENVKKVIPYLDQIYCDCKLYDKEKHIQYTGVSNDLILKNIEYLLSSNVKDKVMIRTPLIPFKTATKENIKEISNFISTLYKDVHYELLNFNPLAKAKYAYLDRKYCFDENPALYTKEEMNGFYEIAKENGIRNLIR